MSLQTETTLAAALDLLYAIRREANSKKSTTAGKVAAIEEILKTNSKEITAMMKIRRAGVNEKHQAKKAEPKASRAKQVTEKVAKTARTPRAKKTLETKAALTVGQLKNKEIKVGRKVETITKVTRGKNGRNAVTADSIIPVDQIVEKNGTLVWKKTRTGATAN